MKYRMSLIKDKFHQLLKELWPMISELVSALDKTANAFKLTRPRMGLLGVSLRQSVMELWPFVHIRNLFNFVSTHYFENDIKEINNIFHMH